MIKQNNSINILTKYFAQWSAPFNNNFSNISKLLLPYSDIVNSNIDKVVNLVLQRYRNNDLECYNNIYRLPSFGKYKSIKAETHRIKHLDGRVELIGKRDIDYAGSFTSNFFTQFPITGFELAEIPLSLNKNYFNEELFPGTKIFDKKLSTDCTLYISPVGQNQSVFNVVIMGSDSKGETIIETLKINKESSSETFYKYSYIYKIETPNSITISDRLDLSKYHSIDSDVIPPKRITNKYGDFISPYLEYDDSSIIIYDQTGIVRSEEIRFDTESNLKSIYLTNSSDIISLDEAGWINTYKPYPMYDLINANGSLNNNPFIFVEEEESKIGYNVRCRIFAHDIAKRYRSDKIKITLYNGDDVFYLNKFGQLSNDENTWISSVSSADIINLSVQCTNTMPYIFSVTTLDNKVFYAASYQDASNNMMLMGGITNMFVFNRELCFEIDNKFYTAKPIRHIWMQYDDNEIVLDSDYKSIELT